jgi:hypothetical protein
MTEFDKWVNGNVLDLDLSYLELCVEDLWHAVHVSLDGRLSTHERVEPVLIGWMRRAFEAGREAGVSECTAALCQAGDDPSCGQ